MWFHSETNFYYVTGGRNDVASRVADLFLMGALGRLKPFDRGLSTVTVESFLPRLKGELDGVRQASSRHRGREGSDGRGLPDGDFGRFAFATGVECSAPVITGPDGRDLRRDLLDECGHYDRFEEDLALVRDLGLKFLRYGLPLHKTFLGPDRYDWSFADLAMREIQRLGLIPILDLMHFGVPDWIGDFQNPDLPILFARYCSAVAERYPWVRSYTPVNEIWVTAQKSAKEGVWNERRRDDRAFVTALKNLTACARAGCAGVVSRRADAVFITSETAEYTHDLSPTPGADVKMDNRLRYVSFDLLYGKQPEAIVYQYLMDNGLTADEFAWFMGGEPPGHQIMGNDYYGRNERMRLPDGTMLEGEDVLGWYLVTQRYYNRYYKPLFHTETNVFDAEAAPAWLWKQWANVLRMRRDGVPVLGFTWYSLTDQVDWHIGLAEKRGEVNACGLYDLDRKPRPVAAAYRMLIENFGRISVMPHTEMLTVSTDAASLKVAV